jgi:hypothetical protein
VLAALLLAGCGSSTKTTSATPTTQAAVAAATTTVAQPAAQKLTKKQLTAQHLRGQREAAKDRQQARKAAAAKRAEEAKENRLAAEVQKEETARKVQDAANSNAKKLVEIWKQEPAEANDSDVEAISRHLVSLSHKCSQNVSTLAGYIYSGVEILKKEGTDESPVEIAAGLDKAAPGKKVAPDCRGILAALLVEMEKR